MSTNNLAKSAREKDQSDNDLCKKHSSRCDKDYNRIICPSKLSKKELEDLYYSLLENNLELKRTINGLTEKNRILSTKVQRMTAQTKMYIGKDCCAAGKAVINEQKAALSDLTKANEALADRVRRLSTQLCTAKQFLKQNPNARHCYKCYANTTTSVKNLSTTSLQKSSNVNLKSAAASAIQLHQEPPSTRTAQTNTADEEVTDEKGDTEKVCNENRCRTTMEQFKQKIGDLEEELAKTHTEYSTRMTQLESQVSQLQAGAARARSEISAHAHDSLLLARRGLRQSDAEKAELETQLAIEKRKVAELEMRLKAAELSQQVSQTVEDHLSTARRLEEKQLRETSVERCSFCSNTVTQPIPTTSATKPNQLTVPDDKVSKSDDSGYADHRQDSDIDDKNINQTNQDLMNKIEEMQEQLNALKSITVENRNSEPEASPCSKTFDQYYSKSDDDQEIKDDENVPSKHAQISIFEPKRSSKEPIVENNAIEVMATCGRRKSRVLDKLDPLNEMDIPSKDSDDPSKDKYERDISSLSNRKPRAESSSSQEQAAKTTTRCECPNVNKDNLENGEAVCENCECKKHSKTCANSIHKEDSLNENWDETADREDGCSISLKIAVGGMNTKSNTDDDNVSVSSSTPAKRNRVSLVLFENGTENRVSAEIEPKSTRDSILKDPTPDPSKIKPDAHNSQQIPGPLTVNNITNCKRRISLSEKTPEYYGNKPNAVGQNINKTQAMNKEYLNREIKSDHGGRNNAGKAIDMTNNVCKKLGDKEVNDIKHKGLVIETPERFKTIDEHNDSLLLNRSHEKLNVMSTSSCARHDVADKGVIYVPNGGEFEAERLHNGYDGTINGKARINDFDLCQHHATICTCPERPGPSLALFRSCSGTQTLALPSGGGFRRCGCSGRTARYASGPIIKDKPIGTSTPKADRVPTSPHTYTIDSGNPRADSPANTDNEISVMTDLPSEKDDTSDRLSPGEQRPSRDSTDTCSLPCGTLSEGEVPGYQQRRTSKSVGEVRRTDYDKEVSYGEQRTAAEKMEATLLAISQELARCRSLLMSQRPMEQRDAAIGPDYRELPLRKTAAKSRIDGTLVSTCLFIMHVVSIVFTDEMKAALTAHDTELMMRWQFADCKPMMIPLDAQRVAQFDYSTQHELQMSNKVVDYLKKEDLSIMISEMDNLKNYIASCALPLRQVLSNINNRIDFSLPLTASPYLRAEALVPSNAGDDVGVLDVWCMLLCDQTPLSTTSQTIAQGNGNQSIHAELSKDKNLTEDTEARQLRQTSFQRPNMIVPIHHGSHRQTSISLEGRHQVGFEVPQDFREKKLSLLECYETNNDMKRHDSTISQQSNMAPRKLKSQYSKGRRGFYLSATWGSVIQKMVPRDLSSDMCADVLPDDQIIEITILWLSLNENCESLLPKDRKLYVAYTFLGRDGAELETPVSLPRPNHYTDKCVYNFSKSFNLTEMDMRVLEHMASCRSHGRGGNSSNDCIVFTVVSEPPEDPLGLDNCEDIGFAFLYFGDLLAYSSGNSFTEALPVRGARAPASACGVLAVRVDGLDVLRACRERSTSAQPVTFEK